MEIYNDQLRDLLAEGRKAAKFGSKGALSGLFLNVLFVGGIMWDL